MTLTFIDCMSSATQRVRAVTGILVLVPEDVWRQTPIILRIGVSRWHTRPNDNVIAFQRTMRIVGRFNRPRQQFVRSGIVSCSGGQRGNVEVTG